MELVATPSANHMLIAEGQAWPHSSA
jgi:hypothetical protein